MKDQEQFEEGERHEEPDMLGMLEELCDRVLTGRIVDCAIAVVYDTGGIGNCYTSNKSIWPLVGSVRDLERRMLQSTEDRVEPPSDDPSYFAP